MTKFKAEIGIICAMDVELAGIKEMMTVENEASVSGIIFYYGTLEGKRVVAARCGVGKVFAAICAEAMIMCYSPNIVVNSGVAGGLSNNLSLCDAAIADAAVQHDMDTSPLGDPEGLISGINKIYLPCDGHAAVLLSKCAEAAGVHAECGVIASGDKFISSDSDKERLKSKFSAIACEMEGASVAHVCFVNDVKCAVLRTISDGGNDNAKMDFPEFCAKAARQSHEIIKNFVRDYK